MGVGDVDLPLSANKKTLRLLYEADDPAKYTYGHLLSSLESKFPTPQKPDGALDEPPSIEPKPAPHAPSSLLKPDEAPCTEAHLLANEGVASVLKRHVDGPKEYTCPSDLRVTTNSTASPPVTAPSNRAGSVLAELHSHSTRNNSEDRDPEDVTIIVQRSYAPTTEVDTPADCDALGLRPPGPYGRFSAHLDVSSTANSSPNEFENVGAGVGGTTGANDANIKTLRLL